MKERVVLQSLQAPLQEFRNATKPHLHQFKLFQATLKIFYAPTPNVEPTRMKIQLVGKLHQSQTIHSDFRVSIAME